jgi:sugar/nucleoside kinase (ribokinase family)
VGHLHVSGYTLFAEPGLRLARTAMRAAGRAGVPVSVDPASTGFLRDFGHERFIEETRSARLVFPNRDEALALTGADTVEDAARRLSLRYGTAVVKLGALGALLARHGRVTGRAPAPAAPVVDSTGAGDAFAAGFLASALAGADGPAALEAACRAGAAAVAHLGGRPADPCKSASTLLWS